MKEKKQQRNRKEKKMSFTDMYKRSPVSCALISLAHGSPAITLGQTPGRYLGASAWRGGGVQLG